MPFALASLIFSHSVLASERFDHTPWQSLLQHHVYELRGGQATEVDYAGFNQHRDNLKAYLNQLAEVSQKQFDQWEKTEQLAFLINAYNAWTVELILTRYPELDSIKDLGSLFSSPWKKEFIPLLGEVRSLDDIEHGLIRGSGRYNEPRIHFAVNCASIGCPALARTAYTGDQLEQQLEQATQGFLMDRTRNRLNDDELEVSSIFKWYREDFEQGWRNTDSLATFLALYSDALGLTQEQSLRLQQNKTDIDFLSYDWKLNKRH
ncbi:DUF547 domain-containing protein [Oceanospirillum sp. D5]|uniref:DUF547 domain-containing protein n=2 Tax=Oceanospirillum sediminis TaxID=2760088 RepID=A0A839ITE9_9GAMM|nr:DUF547 domain-containing protein [Oceanospirillum sediminis]